MIRLKLPDVCPAKKSGRGRIPFYIHLEGVEKRADHHVAPGRDGQFHQFLVGKMPADGGEGLVTDLMLQHHFFRKVQDEVFDFGKNRRGRTSFQRIDFLLRHPHHFTNLAVLIDLIFRMAENACACDGHFPQDRIDFAVCQNGRGQRNEPPGNIQRGVGNDFKNI